jgi:hypothetical protein
MSDIVFETTHTDEAAVASQIKDAVSAWSNRIPHHNFRNFGERITVRSIVNRPAYYIALQTQYENREVKTEYMPFRGQELPQRNYATAAEVDFWADFFAPIENFTNHTDKLIIPGSQYRSTCHSCSGEGKITCPKCDGHKEVKCHSCGGKGHRRCETCGGVRTRNCTHCGGSGKQSIPDAGGNYPSCSHCSGGKIPCPSCEGRGTRPCGTCARTGYVPCGNCNQTGFVKCKACDGQGYLYHFLRLYRHLTTEKTGTTVFHPDLDDVYKQLEIDKSRLSQLAVLNQSAEQLDDDAVAQAPFLQQSYTDVLSSARQKASSHTRIQMQQLIVYRWDVFVVDYTYNDEALALVVHGPNDDVIARTARLSASAAVWVKKRRPTLPKNAMWTLTTYCQEPVKWMWTRPMRQSLSVEVLFSVKSKPPANAACGLRWFLVVCCFGFLVIAFSPMHHSICHGSISCSTRAPGWLPSILRQ